MSDGAGFLTTLGGHFTYFITVFLMMAGLFIVIARGNLIKKLVGLSIFQTSVYLLYIAPGKLVGGTAPILSDAFTRLFEPVAARADPHRHRGRRGDARARSGAGRAHPRGLRQHRGGRHPEARTLHRKPHTTTMNLAQHLPALQVVVPLLAAPLTVLLRRRTLAFAVVLAASWIAFAISVLLWLQVDRSGTISYAIGNWPPPWGIEYRVDRLSAFVLVLVSGLAAVVLPYSRASIESEIPAAAALPLLHDVRAVPGGLLGITITGDAFNVFVFLEISSLSTYVLIALGRDRRALIASYQYLIMGTIGATFIVIGVGLLYLMTGTLNLADIAQRLSAVAGHTAGAGGAGVPDGRHLAEAGAVSAASVAAERLHVCAVGGVGVSGGHCHQGRGVSCCCASTFRCSAHRRCSINCRCSR